MKRILPALALPLFLFLAGCSVAKPISVAKKYFAALEAMDYEAAKKYITEDSRDSFEFIAADGESHKYSIERVEEGEDGTTARVYYVVDSDGYEKYIDMVKVNDQWFIYIGSDK